MRKFMVMGLLTVATSFAQAGLQEALEVHRVACREYLDRYRICLDISGTFAREYCFTKIFGPDFQPSGTECYEACVDAKGDYAHQFCFSKCIP